LAQPNKRQEITERVRTSCEVEPHVNRSNRLNELFYTKSNTPSCRSLPSLAGKVEERCVAVQRREREGQISLGDVSVLERVPESVAFAEQLAANLVPVALGVVDAGGGGTGLGSD
jgi:hypothetical protein